MKRLSRFVVLALLVGGGVGVALASANTINGCEIVDNPTLNHHTDCPGANLRHAYLSSLNLSYANLSGAVMKDAEFDHVDLSQANLSGAKLQYASFDSTPLIGAHLNGANLTSAGLAIVDLSDANLSGADLSYVIFVQTKFCHTTMPDGSINDTGVGQFPRGCGVGAPSPRQSRRRCRPSGHADAASRCRLARTTDVRHAVMRTRAHFIGGPGAQRGRTSRQADRRRPARRRDCVAHLSLVRHG